MKEKQYKYITIRSDDEYPDTIFGIYAPRLEIDLAIAHELIENRIDFTEGEAVYTLIDFTNIRSVSKEARDYMNSADGGLKLLLGGAFLSNNIVATLVVNLYLKVSNPSIPAKFFTNRAEALKWIKKINQERLSPLRIHA